MSSMTTPAGIVLSEKLSRTLSTVTLKPFPASLEETCEMQKTMPSSRCWVFVLHIQAKTGLHFPTPFSPRSKLHRTTLTVSLSTNITKIKGKEQNKCQSILGVIRKEGGKVHFAYAAVEVKATSKL